MTPQGAIFDWEGVSFYLNVAQTSSVQVSLFFWMGWAHRPRSEPRHLVTSSSHTPLTPKRCRCSSAVPHLTTTHPLHT